LRLPLSSYLLVLVSEVLVRFWYLELSERANYILCLVSWSLDQLTKKCRSTLKHNPFSTGLKCLITFYKLKTLSLFSRKCELKISVFSVFKKGSSLVEMKSNIVQPRLRFHGPWKVSCTDPYFKTGFMTWLLYS